MARKSYRVQFPGGNGHSLAGIIDQPDDRQSFPVAVFSHCFTCNKDLKAIVRVSRGLAELGIAVLRFDMTGIGGSEGDFSHTNFSTNLADLRSAIEYAESKFGAATALIGHSFGGAASLAIAGGALEQTGQPPRAVVTFAAPSDTQHLAWLLAKMDPAIESSGVGTVTIGGRQWTIRREMLEDLRGHELPDLIPQIEAATLLMHSPVDETVSYDHALRIMGLIQSAPQPAAAVSLVSLDGADHLLVERPDDIDFVITTTAAFLTRYATPK